jgi:hypothetical protein
LIVIVPSVYHQLPCESDPLQLITLLISQTYKFLLTTCRFVLFTNTILSSIHLKLDT